MTLRRESNAPPDNVDALMRKAEEYAKAIESAQAKKSAALAPPTVAATSKNNEVAWLDGERSAEPVQTRPR